MRPPDNGASRHPHNEPLPRVCALLGPRERSQVEAATHGQLTILHRSTVSGIYDDIATGHADGAVLSVAVVREADIPRLAGLVRDLPATTVLGLVGEDGGAAAVPGILLLGRAGVTRLVDIRERTGWGALRDAFTLELPEGGVRPAVASVIEVVEMEPDGTQQRCSEGIRRFLTAIFGPGTTTAIAIAEELGVPPSTLSSRFARAGLPSPKQYLALAKLVRAAFLGEAPGMTIRAISERLQVSSPQAYGRMVRHMTGMTGLEYRQAINGAAALARFISAAVTPHRDILRGFDPLLMRPRGAEPAAAGRAA